MRVWKLAITRNTAVLSWGLFGLLTDLVAKLIAKLIKLNAKLTNAAKPLKQRSRTLNHKIANDVAMIQSHLPGKLELG